jgi:hypothetical protein
MLNPIVQFAYPLFYFPKSIIPSHYPLRTAAARRRAALRCERPNKYDGSGQRRFCAAPMKRSAAHFVSAFKYFSKNNI